MAERTTTQTRPYYGPQPVTDPSDPGLVRLARTGDVAAFEELYRRNVSRVYALCVRILGDRARAEEQTQRAFVRAWERLGTLRDDGAFSSWLRQLARNEVISSIRQEVRAGAQVAGAIRVQPDVVTRQDGTRMDLERAIGALPTAARTVFVLHDVEGHKHHEIATLLGVSVGTSKSQLHRARRLLREALA